MREKIQHMIAQNLIEQGQLKLRLRNLLVINELTDEIENQILDEITEKDEIIKKLREILKQL